MRAFLAKNNAVTMSQPPYLPDMAPCKKEKLKGLSFFKHRNKKAKGYPTNRV